MHLPYPRRSSFGLSLVGGVVEEAHCVDCFEQVEYHSNNSVTNPARACSDPKDVGLDLGDGHFNRVVFP